MDPKYRNCVELLRQKYLKKSRPPKKLVPAATPVAPSLDSRQPQPAADRNLADAPHLRPAPLAASPAPLAASPAPLAASPAPLAASPAPLALSPALAASPAIIRKKRKAATDEDAHALVLPAKVSVPSQKSKRVKIAPAREVRYCVILINNDFILL
jgi:hypothetical protein